MSHDITASALSDHRFRLDEVGGVKFSTFLLNFVDFRCRP